MSVASRTIFSNFFEEQSTQNYPQYLSGLSRAFFRTTFLEIAGSSGSRSSFVISINTTLSKARELKRTFYVIVAKANKFFFTA